MTGSEAENGLANPDVGTSPSVFFAESAMQQLGVGGRASSPAKRSASELEDSLGQTGNAASDHEGGSRVSQSPEKSSLELVSPMPSRFKSVDETNQPDQMMLDVGGDLSGSTSNHGSEDYSNAYESYTPPTSVSVHSVDRSPTKSLPSYDEQWSAITEKMQDAGLNHESAKGFLLSCKWLSRLRSRTSDGSREPSHKKAREGKVGPIDNSDIVANDQIYGALRCEAGENFVPLREDAQLGEDFEILPEPAWALLSQWYSVTELTHVMIRTMHSTAGDDAIGENLQFELFPPICTVQKLWNEQIGHAFETTREQDKPAPSLVASRRDSFNDFLKRAKDLVGIDARTKVRVWKILETGETSEKSPEMPTPVSSRNGSPIPQPQLSKAPIKMLVDMNAFTSLGEGTQRERLEFNDETANEKYNGHLTLDTIGFPSKVTLVLEEEDTTRGREESVSDGLSKKASSLGVDLKSSSEATRSKLTSIAGRRSPTPSGAMTRGRTTKKGRTRGCTGLVNLGNTCYMNSALQCIRSVQELTVYFLEQKYKEEINAANPLGHAGAMAKAYNGFLEAIYSPESSGSFAPRNFKGTLGRCQPLFSGYGQQDSQEFLSFLVDSLHEDLNRIIKKPYMENPESDDKTVHQPEAIKELGETFRYNHRARNDSVAMDLFNGFYKNTMICPVCEKVSVTFDPYSLLTLQLPIEQTFQHIFTYAPLRGSMFRVKVDIDKNSSIGMLKEYFAKRVHVPAARLIIAEEYNQKFYQILEDVTVISEANLAENDKFVVYELDEAPSNWPPPQETKRKNNSIYSSYSSSTDTLPDMNTAAADRMAVPIVHRVQGARGLSFGLHPSIILVTRDEAKDADKILRKVLQKINCMTTVDLFSEQDTSSATCTRHEDGDTVERSQEDTTSTESGKIKARSVEGEDGLVDVSVVNEAPSAVEIPPAISKILDPRYYIEPELRNLFDLTFYWNGSYLPASLNLPADATRTPTLESRIRHLASSQSSRRTSNASVQNRRLSSASSEDELVRPSLTNALDIGRTTPPDSDEETMSHNKVLSINRPRKPGALKAISKSNRNQSSDDAAGDYLLRLGEGLIVDWTQKGYEQLFEGEGGAGQRGARTDLNLDTMPDEELDAKRSRRATRKHNGLSLAECFEETAKSEVLSEDNAWYCNRCKELRRATKKLEIWTVPDILVIHLKRFSTNSRMRDKIDVLVDFPVEGLDLEGKVGLPEDKALLYDLFAVDNHYGGLGGGHYTAYAQNFFDKKWYDYNDQIVSQVAPQSTVTRAAYLLFYRRRSDGPLGGPGLEEIMANAYATVEPLSGEDTRPDDTFSSGSSEGSLGAGQATGARVEVGANHPSAQNPGPGSSQLDQSRENGSERDLDDHRPHHRGNHLEDEGIAMDYDPDHPVPSMEGNQRYIGPSEGGGWSFSGVPELHDGGYAAPPGSDTGSMTLNASEGPAVGELSDRMLEDFGDDVTTPAWRNDFEDESRVEHVRFNPDDDVDDDDDDDKVVDIKIGSDDERNSELR